ncbi:dipeptidyl-peptidase III [Xylona heveae TC161]|uniref:Dipeptidyl peptidase 3 n=1 Tax=Xylona heveae (strain CBS 132557 / TC161) TaxID=1328760 RepID=A0A165JJX7_XYLHT|nr:dipeptidyl-peptidase III [Xylona heveae TC161]KZF26332.1 dipeptidyl-peptidase III [Xylona heveae TC161]
MEGEVLKHYLADSPPSVVRLEIKHHFDALTDKQKHYAHYISRAAFLGTRITLRQVSPESEHIYDFIIALYHSCNGDWKKLQRQAGITDNDLKHFLEYSAQFLGNLGNYKSFGDSKFVPRASPSVFITLASTSPAAMTHYQKTNGAIFAAKDVGLMHLGYTDEGHLTTYYPDSPTITKEEITLIGDFLEKKKLLLENTRLRKTGGGDFELLIASGTTKLSDGGSDVGKEEEWPLEGNLDGKKLRLVFGDYANEMAKITDAISGAEKYAANETQVKMHQEYAKSFRTGSLEAFKQSQRHWIQDKSPDVECDLGFVETYRDPHGVRGEWEGFVSMVNQERTRAFGKLVASAESMIPKLPWNKEFEKDKFLSPDFSSLEVLTFAGSGIPAGINIPNYDDIRQTEGFKNVSLGNVLSAKAPDEPVPFIRDEDLDLYQANRDAAFEVQVGIHELLGHGTGKLLQETSPGTYNFDISHPPISPITNAPVKSWYKPGQTWGSVFGSIAGSYEECRAECVAMALSCDFEILQIFGFGDGSLDMDGPAGDVLYIAYLQMARAGIVALEFWDPKSRKWGQAHMQARFSILQTFLGAGDDFVKLVYTKEDLSDLSIALDRTKILSHGRPAIERYLQKLHVFKSTADYDAGKKLYDDITHVDPEFWGSKLRNEVLRRKVPRKVFVQANTVLDGDKVVLKEYEPSLEGMIQSYAERNV